MQGTAASAGGFGISKTVNAEDEMLRAGVSKGSFGTRAVTTELPLVGESPIPGVVAVAQWPS